MQINAVDTHVHCWDLQRTRYSWLDNVPELNRSFDLDELEEQRIASHVAIGVLVQAANSLDDTASMLRAAAMHPWIKGVVGWLPLQNPVETARLLDNRFTKTVALKGIRHLIHDEANPRWLLQDTVLESLGLVSKSGLSFDFVGVNTDHLQTALELAEKVPGLHMVFDHLNQPPLAASEFGQWQSLMKAAASNPNYYVKISGLGTAVKKGINWTTDDIKPAVAFVLETFGLQRCFCGGDWPVSTLAGSYNDLWSKYRSVLEDLLNLQDQESVLCTNALAFYRL